MLSQAAEIYRGTRKKHDLLFNLYVMRPIAAGWSRSLQDTGDSQPAHAAQPLHLRGRGGHAAAYRRCRGPPRHRRARAQLLLRLRRRDARAPPKTASKSGHLFDFFTDELKAILLVAALGDPALSHRRLRYRCDAWAPDDRGISLRRIAEPSSWHRRSRSRTSCATPKSADGRRRSKLTTKRSKRARLRRRRAERRRHLTTFLRFLNHYPATSGSSRARQARRLLLDVFDAEPALPGQRMAGAHHPIWTPSA